MKIRSVSRKFKTWIKQLWEPKTDLGWDDITMESNDPWLFDLIKHNEQVRDERINVLIAEREAARKAKKKHSHIQAEIESLRTEQLRG